MSDRSGAVTALSLASVGVLGVVAAYQTGMLKHLPTLGKYGLNAERVHRSREGDILGIPDALLGMASYGTTAALAALDRRKLLAAKAALDVSVVAGLASYGWRRLHAVSEYSMLVAAASIASFALALTTLRRTRV